MDTITCEGKKDARFWDKYGRIPSEAYVAQSGGSDSTFHYKKFSRTTLGWATTEAYGQDVRCWIVVRRIYCNTVSATTMVLLR